MESSSSTLQEERSTNWVLSQLPNCFLYSEIFRDHAEAGNAFDAFNEISGTRKCTQASSEVPSVTGTLRKSASNDLQSKCPESPPSKPEDCNFHSS
jgi:hypothetical protein